MTIFKTDTVPLGMGCWPIGGPMFSGDTPLGYTNSDDATSIKTIHAALDHGITIFDTAAAYGAGHSERLLGQALHSRTEAMIITKIGIGIDEETKQLTGDETTPDTVGPAIDRCLNRLNRDCIDLILLHQNELPVETAGPLFAEMEKAVAAGKIRAYGWSTDFADSAAAMADAPHFVAVEHAMNLFFDAPRMQTVIYDRGLTALLRSPLAMGLLSGKYDAGSVMPSDDIRANALLPWADYYVDGRVNPAYLDKLDAVRALLTVGGRSLVQGAVCWLWAKNRGNIPIPGARTPDQITELAGAYACGPLPDDVMADIARLIPPAAADAPDRPR